MAENGFRIIAFFSIFCIAAETAYFYIRYIIKGNFLLDPRILNYNGNILRFKIIDAIITVYFAEM